MRRFLMGLLAPFLLAATSWAEKIELENGDELDVKIIEQTDSELVVEHPQLGRMVIPKKDIRFPVEPIPGLFGTSFLKGWTRNVGAGFSGSSGNSSDSSFNASLAAARSTKTFRGAFTSAFFFASKKSSRITNDVFANYQHDFLLSESRFFIFLRSRYQFDQFQAWRHRVSMSTGPGYDIIKTETVSVRGEFGFGFSRTWGTEREWRPEGVLGASLSWKPFEGHKFSADATYYPDLADLSKFRFLSNAAYTVGITRLERLSLKLGAKNEYDSKQPNHNNNLKYYGNLLYDF